MVDQPKYLPLSFMHIHTLCVCVCGLWWWRSCDAWVHARACVCACVRACVYVCGVFLISQPCTVLLCFIHTHIFRFFCTVSPFSPNFTCIHATPVLIHHSIWFMYTCKTHHRFICPSTACFFMHVPVVCHIFFSWCLPLFRVFLLWGACLWVPVSF